MTNIKAAIRDPKTGKIYTGDSHSHILDDAEDGDKEVLERLQKIYVETGKLIEAEHVGFVGPDGLLLPRAQSLKKWGVSQSNDLRHLR